VLGNGDEGLGQAAAALSNPSQAATLGGKLAIAEGGRVFIHTSMPAQAGPAVTDSDIPAITDPERLAELSVSPERRSWWLLPGIALSLGALALIAAYVLFTSLRDRRAARAR